MPLINHVRGDVIPNALLNVRTPMIRLPLWVTVTWSILRVLGRLVVVYLRFWPITLPVSLLLGLYVRFGWAGPVTAVVAPTLVLAVWWWRWRSSFRQWAWWPALSRYRRMVYRRSWHAAMVTAGLSVTFDRMTVLPVLKRVRCTAVGDAVTVRMVTGQIPDDYATVALRLAHTFGARSCTITPGSKPELVGLTFLRGDLLTQVVVPMPVAGVPDFTALPVALRENGQVYALRLFGTQVLIVGATGSGKGSVVWSIIRALAGGVQARLVQLWVFDPKGGMELGAGAPLFARFACDDYQAMADMLDEALKVAQTRAARLRGVSRQHTPTADEPLIVIIIDELAALTAYLTDRKLKDRIKASLGMLLTQGRAVGVHVVAALQDPRKEVLPFRNLFPTRIGLRLAEESEVDMVLGEGTRDRGALCDRIPLTSPGVGYVVLEGNPTPTRVRFSYLDDPDITDLAHTHGRLRLVDGGEAA
ncbi:MAG: cell division protein FtsK [Micromonosporaceae bacterium]|nr:cell division protein FtsK [Micromonosporaceae bacterium]